MTRVLIALALATAGVALLTRDADDAAALGLICLACAFLVAVGRLESAP